MPMLIGLGIGAVGGAAQHFLVDEPQYQRKMQLAAATQRYSPWTGAKPNIPEPVNPMSDITQMAATGAGMGQSIENAGLTKDNLNAQTDYFKKAARAQGFNPWQMMQGMPQPGGPGGFNYSPGSMTPSGYNSPGFGTMGG
jgi:hypothetical protein